jgi:hypothetical protein
LILVTRKPLLIELRRHHDRTDAVRERPGVIAVRTAVASDAMKHQQQKPRLAAAWPVSKYRQIDAIYRSNLLRIAWPNWFGKHLCRASGKHKRAE